jgi:glycosyltransferase involved in cell wall biosynthesis
VKFLGYVAEEELPSLYQNARALLFPQIEDAGLVPLEAMACGTPVIAYGRGGALDTVSEGTSGLFFPERTTESLQGALNAFEARAWDSEDIREHARQFSSSAFQKKIKEIVEKAWESHHARLTPRPAHLRSPLQALPARPQA